MSTDHEPSSEHKPALKTSVQAAKDSLPDGSKAISASEPVAGERQIGNSAYLDVHCPGRPPFKFALGDAAIPLGREVDCAVPLPIPSVSRHHARITHKGGNYSIEDLDSTNGTFVNSVRISRCILRHNDHIRIGDAGILFVNTRGKDQ